MTAPLPYPLQSAAGDPRSQHSGHRVPVLHVCDKLSVGGSSLHGVGRLLLWWFPRLSAAGFAPGLVVLRPWDAAAEYLRERGIEVVSLGRGRFDPRTVPDLVALIRARRPRLLHLHGYGAWTFGRIAARLTRTPVVLHEHMVGERVPSVQRVADRLLAGSEPTLAVSQAVARFCIERRAVAADSVILVPNGIPLAEAAGTDRDARRRIRHELGIGPADPVIGAIARLEPRKGLDYLLQAVPAIRGKHPDLKVLLVGDGELDAGLRALAMRLGVGDCVRFTGYRDDVSAILAALDVVVIPSWSEGLPLALIEALAAGRPIVSTDVGGLGETLRDGATALLVKPRDATQIAARVCELLADPSRAGQLGAAGRRLARERFDIDIGVRAIVDVYRRVAGT